MLLKVEGKPYEAECEWRYSSKLPGGKTSASTLTGTVARDSNGRRIEHRQMIKTQEGEEHAVERANLYDPVGQVRHLIDMKSGALLMSYSLDGPAAPQITDAAIAVGAVPLALSPVQKSDGVDIGQQIIEGMNCRRSRTKGTFGLEHWVADELEETVTYQLISGGSEVTFRMFNIRRTEPDPRLFIVPPADQRQASVDCCMRPGNFGSSVLCDPKIGGKPFSAEVESTVIRYVPEGQPDVAIQKMSVFRDSSGRRRQDLRGLGQPSDLTVTSIVDPASRVLHILDHRSKTAMKISHTFPAEPPPHGEPQASEVTEAASPAPPALPDGENQIEGLACYVRKDVRLDGSQVEYWYSPDLNEVLYERRVDQGGETTVRYFNIQPGELAPSLFEIPSDYRIGDRPDITTTQL